MWWICLEYHLSILCEQNPTKTVIKKLEWSAYHLFGREQNQESGTGDQTINLQYFIDILVEPLADDFMALWKYNNEALI